MMNFAKVKKWSWVFYWLQLRHYHLLNTIKRCHFFNGLNEQVILLILVSKIQKLDQFTDQVLTEAFLHCTYCYVLTSNTFLRPFEDIKIKLRNIFWFLLINEWIALTSVSAKLFSDLANWKNGSQFSGQI